MSWVIWKDTKGVRTVEKKRHEEENRGEAESDDVAKWFFVKHEMTG